MNNKENRNLYLLEDWMFFLITYPFLWMFIFNLNEDVSTFYRGLLLFVGIVMMRILRLKIKNIFIFLMSHTGVIWVFYFLAVSKEEKFGFAFYLIIAFIISFRQRLSKTSSYGFGRIELLLVGEGLLFVGYLLAGRMHEPFVQTSIYLCALVFPLSFMGYLHLKRMNDVLQWVEKDINQAVEPIKKINSRGALGFILLTFLLVLISPYLYIPQALLFVLNWIWVLIKWILTLILSRKYQPIEQVSPEHFQIKDPLGNLVHYKPNPFISKLQDIIIFLVTVAGIIAICVGIIYGCILIYKKFYEKSMENEEKEFVSPFKNTNEKTSISQKNPFKLFSDYFGSTNEHKIRKLYYKYIQKKINEGIPITRSDSPEEIKAKIQSEQNTDVLTDLYEKARYGYEHCTKEDVEEARRYF